MVAALRAGAGGFLGKGVDPAGLLQGLRTVAAGESLLSPAAGGAVVAEISLPAAHRQAILLAFYEGLTYREVAQALHIPEGTAKWRLRTALHRIGERLRAEGFGDAVPSERTGPGAQA